MNAEIITIGDEVITGHITDTNAVYLSRHLTGTGINVKYRTTVGDNLNLIEDAIRTGLNLTTSK